tara:strand:- start:823 stop:1854 length:1032 start_codon:yes stop_codon:yes gene_type:complete
MLKKSIKALFLLGLSCGLVLIITYLYAKYDYTQQATQKANSLIEQALPQKPASHDEEVIAIAKEIHKRFRATEPSNILQLRLRPYISNARLPSFLRFQDGVLETNVEAGLCDNAARMLKFVLEQKNYESVQWNMVTNTTAHSALLVTLPDGRKVFVDPFYGLAAYKNEKLTSPQNLQENLKNRIELEDTILKFNEKSDTEFYENFSSVRMAAQGDFLQLTSTLPSADSNPVFLGTIDGNSEDVKHQAGQHHMTPFWEYMGHKYNREWVRVLKAPQDARLEIILIEDVEDGIITSTPAPTVSGKTLSWNLKAGDEITFRDELAKINWSRLNSYIGVDQIVIYPE